MFVGIVWVLAWLTVDELWHPLFFFFFEEVAPCLSNLTSVRLHLYVPVHCLLERLMDSVRLSGLVSYLPSQGLDDGPVFILVGFTPIAIEYPVDNSV